MPETIEAKSIERTQCPACGNKHTTQVKQCDLCGVIFSKWRDPKQKNAEVTLAKLAAQSSSGLPSGVYIFLIACIAIPLAIVKVPEVTVRTMGANLKYRLSPETFSFSGTQTIVFSGTLSSKEIDRLSSTLETKTQVKSIDSLGDAVVVRTYPSLVIVNSKGESFRTNSATLSSWKQEYTMGSRGAVVALMGTISQNMEAVTNTMKHVENARRRSMDEKIAREEAFYNGTESESSSGGSEIVPHIPVHQQLAELPSQTHLQLADMGLVFKYSSERVKKGYTWKQNVMATVLSPLAVLNFNTNITFQITGFKRTSRGFCAVVEWKSPVDATVTKAPDQPNNLWEATVCRGELTGKALVNYRTGLVESSESTWTGHLIPGISESEYLQTQMGIDAETSSAPINVSSSWSFSKI